MALDYTILISLHDYMFSKISALIKGRLEANGEKHVYNLGHLDQ